MTDVDTFLEHYGIPGMKWGVRRTKKQLARARAQREATSEQLKGMSNDELRAVIGRMQLENQYAGLVSQQAQRDRGNNFVRDLVSEVPQRVVKDVITRQATKRVNALLDDKLGTPGKKKKKKK